MAYINKIYLEENWDSVGGWADDDSNGGVSDAVDGKLYLDCRAMTSNGFASRSQDIGTIGVGDYYIEIKFIIDNLDGYGDTTWGIYHVIHAGTDSIAFILANDIVSPAGSGIAMPGSGGWSIVHSKTWSIGQWYTIVFHVHNSQTDVDIWVDKDPESEAADETDVDCEILTALDGLVESRGYGTVDGNGEYRIDYLYLGDDVAYEEYSVTITDSVSLASSATTQNIFAKALTSVVSAVGTMTSAIRSMQVTVTSTLSIIGRLSSVIERGWISLLKSITSWTHKSKNPSIPSSIDLIAYWKFNDGTGSTLIDSIGDHDGTLKNMTDNDWIAGKEGYALDFDGNNDYVEIADSDDFSFGDGSDDSPFSLCAWIYLDTLRLFVVLSKMKGGETEWEFLCDTSGRLYIRFYREFTHIGREYNVALSTGRWYHVAMTYDGTSTSGGIKIYINAERKDNTDDNAGEYTAMAGETAPVHIGKDGIAYADGKIDEVRIYNKELTSTEVTTIYNYGRFAWSKQSKNTTTWSNLNKS